MKISNYNFQFPVGDGKVLLYNALKNGLALVDAHVAEALKEGGNPEELPIVEELKRGGFLLDDVDDEYQIVQLRWRRNQFATNALSLTIAPTLDCNLGCPYCFETHCKKTMSRETEDAIVSFTKPYLQSGARHLGVTWYGGEPLLCLPTMERLGKKLKSLCQEHDVVHQASVVTNGTLLTPGAAERMVAVGIESAQITLDGFEQAHDQRRPYKNGSGSFTDIYRNLGALGGKLSISIRINVDRHNLREALAFAQALRGEPWYDSERFYVYFGYIRNYNSSCKCPDEEILKPGEFYQGEFEVMRQAVEADQAEAKYPRPLSGCVATSIQGFVLGPDGEIYKCWNHVGNPSLTVGSVREPLGLTALHAAYLMDGFESDAECRRCRYLPICMGGCADIRVNHRRVETASKDCTGWKFYLEKSLRLFFESKADKLQTVDTQAQESPA